MPDEQPQNRQSKKSPPSLKKWFNPFTLTLVAIGCIIALLALFGAVVNNAQQQKEASDKEHARQEAQRHYPYSNQRTYEGDFRRDANGWVHIKTETASCEKTENGYTLSSQNSRRLVACTSDKSYADLTFEGQTQSFQGSNGDAYGLFIRARADEQDQIQSANFFLISASNRWSFGHYDRSQTPENEQDDLVVVEEGDLPVNINTQEPLRLALSASDSHFRLTVNDQIIATVDDSNLTPIKGSVGFLLVSAQNGNPSITFSNASIWSLPQDLRFP